MATLDTSNIDLLIIGGGAAGLTAGMYGSRAGLKTVIVEKNAAGGKLLLIDLIDNFPSLEEGIDGFSLAEKMTKHAAKFGAEVVSDDIISLEKNENIFIAKSKNSEYKARAVIIATGSTYKYLSVDGEGKFLGKGVSYCATCDGPFFKGKDVVVVGGGDSALTEAILLTKYVNSVTLVHRKDSFRAVDSIVKLASNNKKIKYMLNSVVLSIDGTNKVEIVSIENLLSKEITKVKADAIFIFIGSNPNTLFLSKSILDNEGFIKTDENHQTGIEGLFAVGDVKSGQFRQIVTAISDGATAVNNAIEYINKLDGKEYH